MSTGLHSCNAHVTPTFLWQELSAELSRIEQVVKERVTLEPLDKLKDVADATTKVLVRTVRGKPFAVIICSRPAAPDLVARGTRVAEQIRDVIGQRLGEAIIKPMSEGVVAGRSYVVLPYCRDISSNRAIRAIQKFRIRRPLLQWLREATANAVQFHQTSPASQSFALALEHLERQRLFNNGMQAAIRDALERLESDKWRPCHSFDHNDLYLSNIMLPVHSGLSRGQRFPFVLIDWGGANPKGYGIYDLVRVALAFNLSPRALRRELIAHGEALRCELEDTVGHLLATLGRLHVHLEHFPQEHFISMANACWQRLNQCAWH